MNGNKCEQCAVRGDDARGIRRGQERKRTVIIIIVRLIAVVCSGVRAGPASHKSNQKSRVCR